MPCPSLLTGGLPADATTTAAATAAAAALLPILLQEKEWEDIGEGLDDVFLGDAELWR